MNKKRINPSHLVPHQYQLSQIHEKVDISSVFTDQTGRYINEINLFLTQFKAIPNIIYEEDIDVRAANRWFLKFYFEEIKDCYYTKRYINARTCLEYDDIFYFIFDDIILFFDTNLSRVRILFRKTPIIKVNTLAKDINKFKRKSRRSELAVLINSQDGIIKKFLNVTSPELSLSDNYNDDFMEVHKIILQRLQTKNDKGIVLLHGKPGTGKTSYIKYLIGAIKKNVIFLPPNMASCISDPKLISTLVTSPNSIFVIEDAENIIIDRQKRGESSVSTLLNISDGLLSDCLNIQIICSFNTDLSKVDSALLRKGRLIARYEFKELEVSKAQLLSDKLKFTTTIMKPMSLASIYNQDDKEFNEPISQTKIGFRTAL